jgi:small subunit ribosomal protein S1
MPVEAVEEWLTGTYDYEPPRRGQIRQGTIVKIEEHEITVDVGLKRDGFVPREDIKRLGEEEFSQLEPGQEVIARIVRPEDRDGNLVLSLYQAKDWAKGQELLESGDVWQGKVIECNRGGLIVKFGQLRAFVPASHLAARLGGNLSPEQRKARLRAYIGQELSLKVIEVTRDRRRLILSERLARRQIREQSMERLLGELVEGQVCRGKISGLCDFGAFVDLGGADGLIHISELAWRRVRHPREALQMGDEIEVYVLGLDHERRRISLSLKRLGPDPWELVDETYTVEQLVLGLVTNVVDFGAFAALDIGVEGLIHVSELADPPPAEPREIVRRGDELVLRILSIDSSRRRIGLSLKRVDAQEREEWLARRAPGQLAQTDENGDSSAEDAVPGQALEEQLPAFVGQTGDEEFWLSLLEGEEAEKARQLN